MNVTSENSGELQYDLSESTIFGVAFIEIIEISGAGSIVRN